MSGKKSGPPLLLIEGDRARSKTGGISSYRSFDQDGDDLRETYEERKAFDREMNEGLIESWKKGSRSVMAVEVPPGQPEAATRTSTRTESPEIIESSASIQVFERPPVRPAHHQTSEPILSVSSEGHSALPRPPPQAPTRSKTLPGLDTLPLDDPFSTTSFMAPKPSAAMVKLLEAHQAFEKRELKNKMRGSRSKVLDGCRIAVVMSQKAFSSLRDKWNLISLHGGIPLIRYTSGSTTHIVSDPDVDEPAFLKFLGIRSRAEIEKTVGVVTYEWVSVCIRTRVLQPLEAYLLKKNKLGRLGDAGSTSFGYPGGPVAGLSSKKRELSAVEAIRVGKRARITREITPTDSDTQNSKSLQRMDEFIPVQPSQTRAGPSGTSQPDPDEMYKRKFGLEPGVPADPLDEIILGVKMGTVDISEEGDEMLANGTGRSDMRTERGDSDGGTDDEDPAARDANGKAIRSVARRQAYNKRKETTDGPHKAQQDHDGKIGHDGPNEDIAVAIEELAKIYRDALHKNKFQRESYQRVANTIRNLPYRLESGKQAQEVKGIGAQMAERIQEYIDHGRTVRAVYEDNPESRAVAAFGKIYGVGPALAHSLVSRGARTLDDLRNNPERFGLTEGHRFGLLHYDDLNERIPRDEVTALFELIKETALKIEPKLQIDPMGSYRRGEETSGDLDILMTKDPSDGTSHRGVIRKIVSELANLGIICHTVSSPHNWDAIECKWMGTGKVSPESKLRRIDILAVPFESYGAALIYFTGNDRFNRSLRYYANRQGYSLNQRGLHKGVIRDANRVKQTEGTLVASKTEQEIFDILGIRWRPPHLRRP